MKRIPKSFSLPANAIIAAMLIYIYVGILFFLLAWCVWYVSIISTIVSIYVVYMMYRDFRSSDALEISFSTILGIVIMGVVLYAIGWGRFTPQPLDWRKHNAIINDLVSHDMPVIYKTEDGVVAMLTYYLAQYLFPSAIGKIFGSYRVAEVANALWAYSGLILVYLNVLRIVKSRTVVSNLTTLFFLLFMSYPIELGRQILSLFIDGNPASEEWFYWDDNIKLQYSGNIILLAWVFPQIVVNWMVMSMFVENYKKINYYVPLLLPALLYGSFSFIGLLPYAFVWVVYQFIVSSNKSSLVKEIFSAYNILTALFLGTIIIFYLFGNIITEKPAMLSFGVIDYSNRYIVYIVFVCSIVLPYLLLLFKRERVIWLYYTTLVSLMIYPFFTMGLYNDFTMRTSIPSLFVLMLMLLKMIQDFRYSYVRSLLVVIILFYSSKDSVIKIASTIKNDNYFELAEDESYGTMARFIGKDYNDIQADLIYNYYTYDLDQSFFCKYIAK